MSNDIFKKLWLEAKPEIDPIELNIKPVIWGPSGELLEPFELVPDFRPALGVGKPELVSVSLCKRQYKRIPYPSLPTWLCLVDAYHCIYEGGG